uniref:Uncharacterized protein n=1 Tax=Ascaris lumbricoides TaxID=6252 RepID=A0A9J2NZZ0_ASCLU
MQSPQEGMPQKCSESTSVMFHSPTLGTENALSRIRRLDVHLLIDSSTLHCTISFKAHISTRGVKRLYTARILRAFKRCYSALFLRALTHQTQCMSVLAALDGVYIVSFNFTARLSV